METKMSIIIRKDVDVLIGKEWDFYHFPVVGLSGGILVLWNTKIGNFVITDTSSQVIVGDLSIPRMGSLRIATVYGSRYCKECETLWSLLNKCMVSSNPSIIGGDFNCVLNKDEKRGGKRFLFTKGPRDMKDFMTSCDFHDVGIICPRYTWCNNKEGTSRIWERLDRCLLNSTALKLLPSAATRHLARVASDHSPITFNVNEKEHIKSKIIRFEDTWRMYTAARSIVYHSWMKNDFGEEGMVLQRNINRTLKAIFFWSKSKCKDLNELKVKLKMEILELQSKEAVGNDWSAQDLILLRSKIHELNVTLERLATWWNLRAKERWLEEGDYNSNLFHNFATARRNGNSINQIRDAYNMMQIEEEEIEKKINDEDIQVLSSDFLVMELKKSVFQQGNNRSPDWKDTLIVLIAKVKNPLLPSNYRPISLCQTNYKVVATMLGNRLKMCMPKLITEEQMAFISGRSISEHCLLAQEILHKFKVYRNRKGMMALKLDMEQAWDSMGWPTLDHILKWYGFPPGYANLIMECITDVRFSIIINGRNSKWIMAHSGFRQVSKDIAKEVKSIVDDFCNWTGQRINTHKSQIIFGNIVSNHMRKKVTKVLSFKVVKEMSYLGIKLSLNRLRETNFHDILTNMMDRLNTWGKKFFSLGGKVTLITSSLLTMPNILITHSMIPKKVLLTLEKLCKSFIWDKHDGSHGIHYIAWDDLCKPRSMGGLGLQSPMLKAGPLRANLSWNFLQKPSTIFHRATRAKYGKSILNGTQNKVTYKAWKILLDGGKFLKNITRWNVGNGKEFNVLNDIWILDRCINQ
ncbi:uncharacterized protein LOC110092921 [Dendrobium catenatum]|uniref:uncharacterized protein LOC110092921 n=1 Tax=Dendrobium catenatum TaxID=906689 RepID=UPI0009F4AD38|nr:uncharacterized protein LOC110092921 [Dendrobium catenatum]